MTTSHKQPCFLRLKEVQALIGLSKSTIYDRLNPNSPRYDPSFPKPKKLGSTACSSIGWLQDEIENWIKSRS
jgi:prophage regulatory protein